jgi:hypothetical protein
MISSRARATLAERRLVEQQAGRLAGAAPDAAAQLVQLREAEALGVLDHHDRRVGHVDADFDHGGRDEDLRSPLLERLHRGVLVAPFILPWTRPTLSPKNCRSTSARSSAAATSRSSFSSTSGHTQ